jgi:biotin transporter BioY
MEGERSRFPEEVGRAVKPDIRLLAQAAQKFEQDARNMELVLKRLKAKREYEFAQRRCSELYRARTHDQQSFYGLADWQRGWSIGLVAAIGLISLLFEAYPSWMSALALLESSLVGLVLLTIAFAIFGALLGSMSGLLLRKFREPERSQPLDRFFIFCLVAVTVVYLLAIGILRIRYTLITVRDQESAILAGAALTVLATVGIILACLAGYKSETMECYEIREKRKRTEASIATAERDRDLRQDAFSAADAAARRSIQRFIATDRDLANQSDENLDAVIQHLLQDGDADRPTAASANSEPAASFGTVSASHPSSNSRAAAE